MKIDGKNPWEFAVDWYRVNDIKRSLAFSEHNRPPEDTTSDEFAEWLTEQYRLAMQKGIDLGYTAAVRDLDAKKEAEQKVKQKPLQRAIDPELPIDELPDSYWMWFDENDNLVQFSTVGPNTIPSNHKELQYVREDHYAESTRQKVLSAIDEAIEQNKYNSGLCDLLERTKKHLEEKSGESTDL